jgi:hypothetical protein
MNIRGDQGEPSLFEIAQDANIGDFLGCIALFALLFAGFWIGCGMGFDDPTFLGER